MEMQQIWEKYVLENSLDSFIIDKTIIDSWRLSKNSKSILKMELANDFLRRAIFKKD